MRESRKGEGNAPYKKRKPRARKWDQAEDGSPKKKRTQYCGRCGRAKLGGRCPFC